VAEAPLTSATVVLAQVPAFKAPPIDRARASLARPPAGTVATLFLIRKATANSRWSSSWPYVSKRERRRRTVRIKPGDPSDFCDHVDRSIIVVDV
jgi:hypothetical protein